MPYIFSATGTNGTNVQKYIAQEKFTEGSVNFYNKNHTDFTARNAKWIYNEMENIAQSPDCFDFCENYGIDGLNSVCTSEDYTVSGLPTGTVINWAISNSGIASLSGFGNTATVTANGSGTITLTATISYNNCVGLPSIVKSIKIGSVPLSSYSIFGATEVIASANYHYTLTIPFGVLTPNNIFWRVPAGWTINSGQGSTSIYVTTSSTSGAVQVDFDNTCGQATGIFKTVTVGNGGPIQPDLHDNPEENSITISPNPSTGNLSVRLNAIDKKSGIQQIRIKNKMGRIVFDQKYGLKDINKTLNISLPTDIYFVEIFDGNTWYSEKLSIQR